MAGMLSIDQNRALKSNVDYNVFSVNADKQTLTVGQKLSQARQDCQKNSIDAISEELCIRPHLLEALEQDHFEIFPSACYAAGFLKNYATYLGLNVEQIVAQYKSEFNGSTKKVDLVFFDVDEKQSRPNQMTLSLMILSTLIFSGVWYAVNKDNDLMASSLSEVSDVATTMVSALETDHRQAPVVAQKTLTKAVESPVVATPIVVAPINEDPAITSSPVAAPIVTASVTQSPVSSSKISSPKISGSAAPLGPVRLKAADDAWVRIKGAGNEILVDRIFHAGEEFYAKDHKDLMLMTSNAGAVSVFVGDIAMSSLGEYGEIKENISLHPQDLMKEIGQQSH